MPYTYYVDSYALSGGRGNSPDNPVASWRELDIHPGDSILFARGSFFRDVLEIPSGTPEAPMHIGAYGEGEKPVFCGSVQIAQPENWKEIRENIWEYQNILPTEPCNVIFEDGSCGVLAWEESELIHSRQWYYSALANDQNVEQPSTARLLLFSCGNPAEVHSSIEVAVYGRRHIVSCKAYATFENIVFINSGVHGFAETDPHDITFRHCEFKYIGGKVWNIEFKIRFGNALECWNSGNNILVENCLFEEIYDSCVTHQGPGVEAGIGINITYTGNTFRNFGMAAYEARDKVGVNVVFENNICIGAGEGFSLQEEIPPRRSEIWPQPMGHHLFIWRMPCDTENGLTVVRNNVFDFSPYGAAIYSIVSKEAEAQFVFEGNEYKKAEGLIVRWNGQNYFAENQDNPLG